LENVRRCCFGSSFNSGDCFINILASKAGKSSGSAGYGGNSGGEFDRNADPGSDRKHQREALSEGQKQKVVRKPAAEEVFGKARSTHLITAPPKAFSARFL
jgi:hypothetical protein